jgi:S-formylglutathione hydrolase FrmB
LILPVAAYAQSPQPAKVPTAKTETVQFESKLVGQKLPYIVILPSDYDAKENQKTRYPVIYLLHGLTGHYTDWTSERAHLTQHATKHRLVIVTPEGNNGWYTDSATVSTEKYESYVIQELIPDVQKRYRTIEAKEGRAIAGLSMGGYGALKFGVKYPAMFSLAASMSGAVAAASYTNADELPAFVKQSLVQTFGDAGGPTHNANNLLKIFGEYPQEKIASLPFIYLDCGTEDFLIASNQQFVKLLTDKKIPHEYRQLPGGHTWQYWDRQVQEILRLTEKLVAAPKTN